MSTFLKHLGEIGGLMGLLMGASVLSICEVFDLVVYNLFRKAHNRHNENISKYYKDSMVMVRVKGTQTKSRALKNTTETNLQSSWELSSCLVSGKYVE